MENLEDRRRAAAFGRRCEPGQTGNKPVIVGRELAGEADAVFLHMGATRNEDGAGGG